MRKTIIAILAVLLLIGAVACNADVNSQLFGKKINIKFASSMEGMVDLTIPTVTFEKGETWADVATKMTSEEIDNFDKVSGDNLVTLFGKTFTGTKMSITDTVEDIGTRKYTGAFAYVTEEYDDFSPNNIYMIILYEYRDTTGTLKSTSCTGGFISSVDYKNRSDMDAFIKGIPTTTDAIVNDGTYYILVDQPQ